MCRNSEVGFAGYDVLTDTACHASAPLRWSQAILAALWCRSAGCGHAMVRQGLSAYSVAIAEACNV
jgi:hypothetical protein